MIIGAYITGLSFSQTDVGSEINERVQEYRSICAGFLRGDGHDGGFRRNRTRAWLRYDFRGAGFCRQNGRLWFSALFVGFNLRAPFGLVLGCCHGARWP